MHYAPVIKTATARQHFQVGPHTAVLLGDIEAEGRVNYLYIMAVHDRVTQLPCYYVAAEKNPMPRSMRKGSHFLGIFENGLHINRGESDDWADEGKFTAEALRIIKQKFEQ